MRACWRCKVQKEDDEFPFRNKEKGTRQTTCKECARQQSKEWYSRNKERHQRSAAVAGKRWRARRKAEIEQALDNFKSVPCCDCDNTFPTCCMRLDSPHLDLDPRTISEMVRKYEAVDAILRVAAEFQVVCANCYAIRSNNRQTS